MSEVHRKFTTTKRTAIVTVIDNKLLDSEAFQELSGSSTRLLLIFYRMRRMEKVGKKGHERWCCTNGKELVLPYRTAKDKYGYSTKRFNRAIDALINHGFLDIVAHQGGSIGKYTVYGLSDRWIKYGTDGFVHKPRPKVSMGSFGVKKKD